MCFRHGEEDRVILRLCPALDYDDVLTGVRRSLGQQLKEQWLSDMIGARAGDQVASRFEKLESSQVDFLVAPAGRRNAIAVLGERGRVENDHLEPAAGFVVFLQQ